MTEVLHFQDLVGPTPEAQGLGIGSLLVNTALLYLKRQYPGSTEVFGNMMDPNDPTEPLAAREAELRRFHFWKSFGFSCIEPGYGRKITAHLKALNLKVEPKGGSLLPRWIPLEDFREILS